MLLDTSGLLNYQHKSEFHHAEALAIFERSVTKVTHSYMLAEFIALAHVRGLPRKRALDFTRSLALHPLIEEVVWVDRALHNKALDLLEARMDKNYSLCDAVTFVLMKERGLSEALTNDHHFEQAGFKRLLPERDGSAKSK